MAGFTSYHLQDLTFTGPQGYKKAPYASVAILDPIITIERRHGKYHIAARFNIETAILNYASENRDGRELFFQDICLQYKNPRDNETLFMKPESDPTAALTVSWGFASSTSATVGATVSQTPSGNVSLGLTRSRSLTVEYAMTSWSLSAHRVVSDGTASGEQVRYQWFWAGTQDESGRLSSDLRHAVKRHVVVKRIVPKEMIAPLPSETVDATTAGGEGAKASEEDDGKDGEEMQDGQGKAKPDTTVTQENTTPVDGAGTAMYTWDSLLDFSFSVQLRVKKRLSRLHRLALFSSDEVRGRYLRPLYTESFRFRVPALKEMIPDDDTADIAAMLNQIKKDYENKLDELPEKDFLELASAHIRREAVKTTQRDTTQNQVHLERLERQFEAVRPVHRRRYMTQM
ncbi:hypothetical protein BJX99DRAFT_220830 [Aspergillus californicus]